MNKTVRALVLLAVSLILSSALFFFTMSALYRGADGVDTIETSIRNAHSDPPEHSVEA